MKKILIMTALSAAIAAPTYANTSVAFTTEGLQLAHRDERLEQSTNSANTETRIRFEQAELIGQAGHKLLVIGEEKQGRLALEKAEKLARELDNDLLRDEALAHLANEIASTDDFEKAAALHKDIKDLEVRTKLGWKLVNKLGKAGNVERAQTYLDAMLLEIIKIEGDNELRAELLAGTGASHRFTDPTHGVALVYEAYGLAQGLKAPYERALFFNEVGANLVDIGHRDRATRVFQRAREMRPLIQNPLEQARYLAMLGGEQAEKGQRDAAAKDLEVGVIAAMKVPAGEDRNDVLSEISRNLGQSYQFERGIEVADMIPDAYHRAEGYIRIAKNMHNQNKKKEALALLNQTEVLANQISSDYRRGLVLRKLASEWISLKETAHAKKLIDGVLAAADSLGKPTDSVALASR